MKTDAGNLNFVHVFVTCEPDTANSFYQPAKLDKQRLECFTVAFGATSGKLRDLLAYCFLGACPFFTQVPILLVSGVYPPAKSDRGKQ